MRIRYRRLTLLLSCVLAVTSPNYAANADSSAPRAKGERNLSLSVTMPEANDYDVAIATARKAGIQSVTLTLQWDLLEPHPGDYDDTFPDIANIYYPQAGLSIDLAIIAVSTNQKVMPADLQSLPFDDPVVMERYADLIEHVLGRMPDVDVRSLVLGLEVDALLWTDEPQWVSYAALVTNAAERARAVRPGIQIGIEGLFDGRTGASHEYFEQVDAVADFIAVSYYPLDGDFKGRGPETIASDFDRLVRLYPEKPIEFFQCGYPSSDLNGSSEEEQAEFIRSVFAAWDDHAEQIRSISFTWLFDIPATEIEFYQDFYGLRNEAFAAYLGSIGFWTFEGNGTVKTGWTALVEEATRRGW